MKRTCLTVAIWLALLGAAHAVDLATAFGVSGVPVSVQQGCTFKGVHGATTAFDEIDITANGIDSATISLVCGAVSITASIPSISVNGHEKTSVTFPQTVTASAAGVWVLQAGFLPPFIVVAR